MLKISKLVDYGTVVMGYFAARPGNLHNAREITENTHITLPMVSKILKLLTKQGLLISQRGINGGYTLAQPPENIRLTDIINALEEPVGLTECSISPGECALEESCTMRDNWQSVSAIVWGTLEHLTLADMAQPPQALHEKLNKLSAIVRSD